MSDELDVEAMLEAPYQKEDHEAGRYGNSSSDHKSSSKKGSSNRDKDRDRRSKDHEGDRGRDGKRIRERRRSKERHKGHEPSKKDTDRRSGGKSERTRSPLREPNEGRRKSREKKSDLTPEERDARTVVCMQLSSRIRARDLEEFFTSIGQVRDVKLITDTKTRKSKGIAYVEFVDPASVPLAYGLSGERLLGVPIIVSPSQAERNRMGPVSHPLLSTTPGGPMRLYIGSLHYHITEEMVRAIFEPFGPIQDIKIIKEHDSNKSQGFGFLTFTQSEDAKKALEQMNGFEIAGRPIKLNHVTDHTPDNAKTFNSYDADVADRAGYDLGATGRLQLMAKLAEGTNFQVPPSAVNALNANAAAAGFPAPVDKSGVVTNMSQVPIHHQYQSTPSIATQCFMLNNMFDLTTETNANFAVDIRDDVLDECNKHGGVLHMYVDIGSKGNVYVKCPTITAAAAAVSSLHGRYFGGKLITAAYIPINNYHTLFPDSSKAVNLVQPSNNKLMAMMR